MSDLVILIGKKLDLANKYVTIKVIIHLMTVNVIIF